MNAKLATTFIVIGALMIPVVGHTSERDKDRSSPKSFVKDSVITAKIKAAMAKDKQVSAMRIKVDTDDKGMVELSGNARSQAEADKAVSIAQGVKGVVSVENKIKVVPKK